MRSQIDEVVTMKQRSPVGRGDGAVHRIGIIAKPEAREARPVLKKLAAWLRARKIPCLLDRGAARILGARRGEDGRDLARRCSLLIVLGGDGTLLSVARAAARARTPILGVNLGSLGFLTEVPRTRLFVELERILSSTFRTDERMMLEMRIIRNGRTLRSGSVLNEVVISKKSTIARAVDLNLEVNGRYVTSYKADGLIVSTPTGSTAYSLSAGGPILDPKLDVLILNPICPHTLAHRPLVLSDSVTIDVSLKSREDGVFLTLDGQLGYRVSATDTVRISKAAERVGLVQTGEQDYFHLLRSKLKWGERLAR
jgi:NAD+ kinase